MSGESAYLSATGALEAFGNGSLRPSELLEEMNERAESAGSRANTFMSRFPDAALSASLDSDRRWASEQAGRRPLEGIPLTLNDDLEVAGQPLTESSLLLADHEVNRTEELGERLYGSGAVVHARAITSELLCSPYAHSRMYGSTPNPWNGAFNAGGGAGGAAAALALGTTMLSGGLDLLGLTPVAAASCGVVAFRPSYGRIPLVYPFALDTYGHFAPMARTVADCALLYDQLAGPPGADPALLPSAPRMTPVAEGLEGIRIGWSTDFGGYDVDQDVAANTARAADDLRSAGAELIEVELSLDPEEIGDTLLRHTGHMALPMMARHYARKELMTPHTVAFFDRCREAAQSGSISDAMEVEMRLYEILSQVFSECDALVGPSLAIPAFPLVPDMDDFTRVLCGAAFNICSRHPFVSVPSGFASNGVPTGLIVVAPRYEEATALRVSGAYEKVRRWTPRTP